MDLQKKNRSSLMKHEPQIKQTGKNDDTWEKLHEIKRSITQVMFESCIIRNQ